jgi:peptidoglycan hydrolase CwlO-like protein
MTLVELKASAYDCLAQIEYLQKQLQEINQKIEAKIKEIKDEPDIPTIHG